MASSQLFPTRPKLFFDTTIAGHHVADILKVALADVAEVTTSCTGIADASRTFDAAAFVLGNDPERELLLRLGVFLGALGRERVVLVCPSAIARELPSELQDVTVATFPPTGDGGFEAALAAACITLKEHVSRLTTPAGRLNAPVSPDPDPPGHVARRLRRSLGTANSVRSGQILRIADISATGALLETFGEIPEHQLLDLTLALENGRQVDVTAKVVRIQYPQWGRVGGVGVQFVRFAGDSREHLERYLEATPKM